MTNQETRLEEAFEVATEMLDYLGIEYGEVVELVVNTRFKRTWGQCRFYRTKGTFKISISSKLLNENAPDMGLLNTVVHELLHTCKGCQNHGNLWKRYADKVNAEFNLGVKRCNSSEEKGLPNTCEYNPEPVRYFLKCPACGHVYKRKRICYPVKHPEKCGCKCGHWGLELM